MHMPIQQSRSKIRCAQEEGSKGRIRGEGIVLIIAAKHLGARDVGTVTVFTTDYGMAQTLNHSRERNLRFATH